MQYYSIIDANDVEHDIEATSAKEAEEWAQDRFGEVCENYGLTVGADRWKMVGYTIDAEGERQFVSVQEIVVEYDGRSPQEAFL